MAQPFPETLIIYPKIDLQSIPYIYKNMQKFVDLSLNG